MDILIPQPNGGTILDAELLREKVLDGVHKSLLHRKIEGLQLGARHVLHLGVESLQDSEHVPEEGRRRGGCRHLHEQGCRSKIVRTRRLSDRQRKMEEKKNFNVDNNDK